MACDDDGATPSRDLPGVEEPPTVGAGIRAFGFEPIPDDVRRACRFLTALSNENRLMVLCHLVESDRTVSELTNLVGLGQSAMSQHLARLRDHGLVRAHRDGQSVRYSLVGDEVTRIMNVLYQIYCGPKGPHGAVRRSRKRRT